jgi:3-hydroxybutyryl-CoA dehydrogenase
MRKGNHIIDRDAMLETHAEVGVVGAGAMGTEIAFVFAQAGFRVTVHDASEDKLETLLPRLTAIYDRGVKRGFYQPADRERTITAITAVRDMNGFRACRMVTEAVFERQDVKAAVLRDLDRICQPDCIIATNTSTIPISILASFVSEARQPFVIGTHYFSPASRMKLVEVISGLVTGETVLAKTLAIMSQIGKAPVRVKDVTGFAVNRLLHVFMIEAVRLVEEGVATPEDIDLACRLGLGHPMGPFQLMDATTSSLCLEAQEIMHQAYGERFRPRPLLKQRVRAGFVGGRDRKGWLTR